VKANLASNPRERLSDADVLARTLTLYRSHLPVLMGCSTEIPTFLLAGHDTTSNLLSWALLELAANPSIQASLREECRANPLPATSQGSVSAPLEADELSALDKLPVLDAVIRETLRLRSPVGSAQRAAVKDDVIPLARPYVDRDGVVQESIKIKQGDNLYVPIILVNRLTELWGPDANEWKPERWMHGSQHAGVPEAVKGIPGVWGNMLTFLGGSRGCIGFRFALYE
jgi:cytochrome P450